MTAGKTTEKAVDVESPPEKVVATEAKPAEPTRATMKELFSYADRTDKALMIVGGICAFINGAGMPAFSEIFGRIIDELAVPNATTHVESRVSHWAAVMVYVGIGVFVLSGTMVTTFLLSAERQTHRIRKAYLAALLRQEVAWHEGHKPGELVSRLASDTKVIQQGINDKIGLALMNFGMFVFGYAFGFFRSWRLTLVMLGTLPLIAGVGAMFQRMIISMSARSRDGYASAGEIAGEVFDNVKTVQVFGTEDREVSRYSKFLDTAKAAYIKKEFAVQAAGGLTYFVMFSSYSIAFWFASYLVQWGKNDVGEITATFFAVLMGSFGLGMIFQPLSVVMEAQGAAYKIFTVIRRNPPIDVDYKGATIANLEGHIEFKNVKFSYPTRPDQKLFDNFSLDIPAGKTVAFSGASGCGKSSITNLVQRFYDINDGAILVDGVDLRKLDLMWWRDQVGIVSQEPALFSGTILENVRIGKQDATLEEVMEACRMANIHDTVMTLPQQYETSVGAVGSKLSGGQKQRLAIARAIIKKPKVLILDEATSALDRASEVEVQEALDKVMTGADGIRRTVIVIAHRLTTIRGADRINFMEHKPGVGSVVAESGTFDELMALNRNFAQMARSQTESVRTSPQPESSDVFSPSAQKRLEAVEQVLNTSFKEEIQKEEAKANASPARLIGLAKGKYWAIMLGILGSIISGGIYPAYAVILGKMLDTLALTTNAHELRRRTPLWAALFIAVGLGALIGWLLIGFYAVAGGSVTKKLRIMLFRAILRQDCYFFDTPGREPGALCGFLAGDTEAVHLLWGPSIGYKIQAAANLATGLGIALYFSWRVALVTLAAFPVLMVTGAVQQMMLVGFGALNKERSSADNVAAESLSQIRTVTAFNIRSFQSRLYETLLKGQLKISERNAFISGGLFGFSQFNFYGTFALGFWYGGTLIAVGKASFADVIIACMAVLMAAMGAGEAGGFASKAKDADVAAKRVFALIDRVPTIDSTPDSTSPDVALDTPLPPFDVKFRGVRFIYPTRPRSIVLQHLTTEFNNGRQYGLIGSTGCGKSTIIQLLARFYDPVKGHIEVNGQSLSHLNVRKWREHIGYVQQEPALFSGTVMENIKYAVPDASDEEAMECARYANIHDEILAMADGYNSQVGYRGSQLSGGQKQRVAMARALLRKPKLLLLDEATSALDNVSEAKVMKGVGEAYKKSPFTVVCVAHRLTTIVNADSILLLEAGQIAESGSHQSLLALDGDYKRRWEQYISSQS